MTYVCSHTGMENKWHLLYVLLQYKKPKYLKLGSLHIGNRSLILQGAGKVQLCCTQWGFAELVSGHPIKILNTCQNQESCHMTRILTGIVISGFLSSLSHLVSRPSLLCHCGSLLLSWFTVYLEKSNHLTSVTFLPRGQWGFSRCFWKQENPWETFWK